MLEFDFENNNSEFIVNETLNKKINLSDAFKANNNDIFFNSYLHYLKYEIDKLEKNGIDFNLIEKLNLFKDNNCEIFKKIINVHDFDIYKKSDDYLFIKDFTIKEIILTYLPIPKNLVSEVYALMLDVYKKNKLNDINIIFKGDFFEIKKYNKLIDTFSNASENTQLTCFFNKSYSLKDRFFILTDMIDKNNNISFYNKTNIFNIVNNSNLNNIKSFTETRIINKELIDKLNKEYTSESINESLLITAFKSCFLLNNTNFDIINDFKHAFKDILTKEDDLFFYLLKLKQENNVLNKEDYLEFKKYGISFTNTLNLNYKKYKTLFHFLINSNLVNDAFVISDIILSENFVENKDFIRFFLNKTLDYLEKNENIERSVVISAFLEKAFKISNKFLYDKEKDIYSNILIRKFIYEENFGQNSSIKNTYKDIVDIFYQNNIPLFNKKNDSIDVKKPSFVNVFFNMKASYYNNNGDINYNNTKNVYEKIKNYIIENNINKNDYDLVNILFDILSSRISNKDDVDLFLNLVESDNYKNPNFNNKTIYEILFNYISSYDVRKAFENNKHNNYQFIYNEDGSINNDLLNVMISRNRTNNFCNLPFEYLNCYFDNNPNETPRIISFVLHYCKMDNLKYVNNFLDYFKEKNNFNLDDYDLLILLKSHKEWYLNNTDSNNVEYENYKNKSEEKHLPYFLKIYNNHILNKKSHILFLESVIRNDRIEEVNPLILDLLSSNCKEINQVANIEISKKIKNINIEDKADLISMFILKNLVNKIENFSTQFKSDFKENGNKIIESFLRKKTGYVWSVEFNQHFNLIRNIKKDNLEILEFMSGFNDFENNLIDLIVSDFEKRKYNPQILHRCLDSYLDKKLNSNKYQIYDKNKEDVIKKIITTIMVLLDKNNNDFLFNKLEKLKDEHNNDILKMVDNGEKNINICYIENLIAPLEKTNSKKKIKL